MTDNTLIQFSNDDRNLLRQIAELAQNMNSELSSLKSKFTDFDSRLSSLESKVEERLQDTRPMLQQIFPRLDQIENRLDRIENRLEQIENRLAQTATKAELRDLDRSVIILHKEMTRWIADFDYRLDKIEKN